MPLGAGTGVAELLGVTEGIRTPDILDHNQVL